MAIITTDLLRALIGRATEDHRFGGIQDDELQSIIDYHTNLLRSLVLQALYMQGPGSAMDLFEETSIELDPGDPDDILVEGVIPPHKFPYLLRATALDDSTVTPLDVMPDVDVKARTMPVVPKGITLRGSRVYCSPSTLTGVVAWLADEDQLVERISAEATAKTRQNIIAEANDAYQRMIIENQRRTHGDMEDRPRT